MAAKPRTDQADIVGKVLRDFTKDQLPHAQYAKNIDRWYSAYRGIIENRSHAAEWTSKLHPAYAFQVIETLVASVVDPQLRWKVRGRPRIDENPTIDKLNAGIRANEILLSEQADQDEFPQKQVLFAKQAFIAQASVYKTQWHYRERDVQEQGVVWDDTHGVPVPRLGTVKRRRAEDRPTVEVVDMRDIFFQEGSVSLERAGRVTHRVWYSYDELLQLHAQGVYGPKANGENVEQLKESRDFSAGASNREQDLFSENRTKDKIEVLEQWRREPDGTLSVSSVANRAVLLRNTPSPFWHGDYPFIVGAPVPDIGRIPGVSVVELIAELQEAAWSFLNQRIDMTELLISPPFLIAEDMEGEIEWGPGAQTIVQRPDQISMMAINPLPAEISLKAEELIKADLQNIPGASPTLLGQTDPSTQTATEISLTTTLAQKRISLMKQQFKFANAKVGMQWLKLNQQFITDPRLVQVVGQGGVQAFEEIRPLALQGDYFIAIDAVDESLVRQEQRAEAQAKFQVAVNAAQFFHALPEQPDLNLKAFMDDILDSYDIGDTARYYNAKQPAQGQQMPAPAAAPGGQPPEQGPPQGVTAPQASDANSPSNAFSQSPVAAMQRMGALQGGPNNV